MKISKRWLGGYKITFSKGEATMLDIYIDKMKSPGVHCIAHLLGHFFDKQIGLVVTTLESFGILKNAKRENYKVKDVSK